MNTFLLHSKKIKMRMNSKGFSSVVGAMFMILIAWVLASAFFIYTLSQNTAYNVAVKERNQLDIDRMHESAQVTNTTYTINTDNIVNVQSQIQNTGPSSLRFTNIWVYASNATGWKNYNFTQVDITVQGGSTYSLNQNLALAGISTTSFYNVTSWFITARGNTIALPKLSAVTNNVLFAQVSQGIGSVAFNFEQFWHYDFSGTPAQGTSLPAPVSKNYTVSESKYNLFHVSLTNMDPLGQTIVLDGNSSIYIIGQHSGTVKYATWRLTNVTNNKVYPSSPVRYTIPFLSSAELYFGNAISGIDENNAYPLFILLVGTKGGNEYGQNIPFVSIYLVD